MEAVSFPDIEGELVAFLNAAFASRSDTARARTKVPKDRGRFVKVTRVGGSRSLVHDEPLVVFECWDVDGTKAERLANLTRALVGSMDTEAAWFFREVGGVASFPDPRTDDPRYQFTATFRTRGEAI